VNNNGDNGFEFPYKALSPVDGKKKLFENTEDVYRELEMCYDEIIQKGIAGISKTLYEEHFYFCNTFDLIEEKYQQTIKEYSFSKTFSCPPYPSISETPIQTIEEFMLIEKELNYLKAKDSDGE
tara:strand:- start:569 stop:940 length:372 start_codon:yes stop_codon:yes gene_type:complete